MGYEFICGIPIAVSAGLMMVLGLFITLARLEDWTTELTKKKNRQ